MASRQRQIRSARVLTGPVCTTAPRARHERRGATGSGAVVGTLERGRLDETSWVDVARGRLRAPRRYGAGR